MIKYYKIYIVKVCLTDVIISKVSLFEVLLEGEFTLRGHLKELL